MAGSPTRDQILKEIIKCGKDPIHFIQNYVYIQHPTRGKIKFNTYKYQDDCVADFINHRFNIVLKARQLGLSTLVAAYCLWLAIFHKDKSILILATKLDVAQNFMKKVKFMKDSLPPWLVLAKVTTESKKHLQFSNGSQVKAIPTTEDAGRSEALTMLIVDEAAFIEGFEEIYKGIFPTLSTGGRAILISSPKGTSGVFYDTWVAAEAKKNEFNPIKLKWDVHPEHGPDWFASQAANMSAKDLAQEHLCDFQSSGDTYMAAGDIQWVKDNVCPPVEMKGYTKDIWVWKRPIPEHKYFISADVSRGDAKDYSTFQVIDVNECEVAAEYQGKIAPEKFHEPLIETGTEYNMALICQELNTYGYACGVELKKSGYPNLYYEKYPKESLQGLPINDDDAMCGYTTHLDRPLMLEKLDSLIRNKILKTYSSRLVREFETFVYNGKKALASKGKNDDLVMALAIGVWLVDMAAGKNSVSGYEMAKALLAQTGHSSRAVVNVSGMDKRNPSVYFGQNSFNNNGSPQARSPQYQEAMKEYAGLMRKPAFDPYDFSWVYPTTKPK